MKQFIQCTDLNCQKILIRKSCIDFVEVTSGSTKIWMNNGCVEYVTESIEDIATRLEEV